MYTQNNEESIILNYFNSKKGNYLDIGANDGITFSNTRALYERGWNGVNIEASEVAFERLQKNSPNAKNINIAVGTTSGILNFYENDHYKQEEAVSLVSSLIESETTRWKPYTNFKTKEVKCLRWEDLGLDIDFDFISIDIEGMDYQVLSQIDLSKTSMVCIEWNGRKEDGHKIAAYCGSFGLNKLLLKNAENLIYAR